VVLTIRPITHSRATQWFSSKGSPKGLYVHNISSRKEVELRWTFLTTNTAKTFVVVTLLLVSKLFALALM